MIASIVIVNFNCGPLLVDCVRSCLDSTVPVRVIVSDNGSVDGSIERLREEITDERLVIQLNHANLGFAKGSNVVLPLAKGDFILFLNPDCMIKPDTIEKMLQEMNSHPEAGMAGCLICNMDGSEQAGCRRRVPTPWRSLVRVFHLHKCFPNNQYFKHLELYQDPLPEVTIDMEAISGAFMLVRRSVIEEVGLMDEGYFLHCEDLDWCMRFRQKGWKILFVPDVEITHAKGVCSHSRPVRVEWHKHKGMVRFYRKFFRHQYPLPLMWLVIFTVWVRFIAVAAQCFFRRLFS